MRNAIRKSPPINPSFHDFLHDLTHELLHVDGKIFRSVRLLLTRPGFLTRDYFLGRLARHMTPIRLYPIFSVAFFAVSALVGSEPIFDADEEVEVGAFGELLGLREMSPAEANELSHRAQTGWVPRVMFVLVPLSALLVQFVTRRRQDISAAPVLRAPRPRRILRRAHRHYAAGSAAAQTAQRRALSAPYRLPPRVPAAGRHSCWSPTSPPSASH